MVLKSYIIVLTLSGTDLSMGMVLGNQILSNFSLHCFSRFARMVDKNIYIIQGEISIVVGAIKRNARWSTHTPLVSGQWAENPVTELL